MVESYVCLLSIISSISSTIRMTVRSISSKARFRISVRQENSLKIIRFPSTLRMIFLNTRVIRVGLLTDGLILSLLQVYNGT